MKKRIICLVLLIFYFSSLIAQDISLLGKSIHQVPESMKYEGNFYYSRGKTLIHKKTYKEKIDHNIIDKSNLYIEIEFIDYQTPYKNFKNRYYFNSQGFCDSIIVQENVCLDCAFSEDSNQLYFFNFGLFEKLSNNNYKSIEVLPILPDKKNKSEKCAFVYLYKNSMPPNGICRIWTATIKESEDSKIYKKFIYGKKEKRSLFLSYLTGTGIVLGIIFLIELLSN